MEGQTRAYVPMEVLPVGRVAWARRVRVHHHERVECPAVAASASDVHRRLARHLRRPQLRPAGHLAPAVEHPEQRRRREVVHDVADDASDHERIPRSAHRRRPSYARRRSLVADALQSLLLAAS